MTASTNSQFTVTSSNTMTRPEIETFLNEKREARLATTRPDGSVHLTPIWFWYEEPLVHFLLGESRQHLKNLRNDPRATILIDEDRRYRDGWDAGAKAVMLAGVVRMSTDDADVAEGSRKLRTRYFGKPEPDDAGYQKAPGKERRVLCTLTPANSVSWDFGKGS
jgi:PPOX class probable F420-dependent enzyme